MLYILNIVLKMKQCFGKLKVDDDHFASGVSGWLFFILPFDWLLDLLDNFQNWTSTNKFPTQLITRPVHAHFVLPRKVYRCVDSSSVILIYNNICTSILRFWSNKSMLYVSGFSYILNQYEMIPHWSLDHCMGYKWPHIGHQMYQVVKSLNGDSNPGPLVYCGSTIITKL